MKSSARVSPVGSGERDIFENDSFDILNNNYSSPFENGKGNLASSENRDNNDKSTKGKEKSQKSQPGGIQSNVSKLLPLRLQHKELGMKMRAKKEPLPMKLRALPSSFWLQPNHLTPESPAPVLPPLTHLESTKDRSSNFPTVVTDANTDLLFSLFNNVENNKKPANKKRGRPKKLTSVAPSHSQSDDPCLISTGILPSLSPNRPKPDHPKNINYSQMLNELVIQL